MLSPTIRAFASSDQWRRRSGPFKTSIRRGLSTEEPSLATSITSALASRTTNLPQLAFKNNVPPCHRLRRSADAVQRKAGLLGVQDSGLAGFHHMFGAADSMRRVGGHDLADDQPVEQHPD